MGLCQSSEKDNPERKRSNEIDRYLEKERGIREKECKILLLGKNGLRVLQESVLTSNSGSGESGKSTVLKQMKIINLNGYSSDELFAWRATVYRNVVESAQALIQAMTKLGVNYEKAELRVSEQKKKERKRVTYFNRKMLINYLHIEYQAIPRVN
jgi:guanine nucleotide-binding protein subunit alpha